MKFSPQLWIQAEKWWPASCSASQNGFFNYPHHAETHTGVSRFAQRWCPRSRHPVALRSANSPFTSAFATESQLVPKSSQTLNFLRERMPCPSQVCKTLGKLLVAAIDKHNQTTSEHFQALTQNIFQTKSYNADKGHLPEINIWKQTPECSRLTLVTMVFTFIKSNICNNRALFYAMRDTRRET